VLAALAVAAVHDGHTAVTVDGSLVTVVASYNALGIDRTATRCIAAAVGVTCAAVSG
jgi:hypothetical protein